MKLTIKDGSSLPYAKKEPYEFDGQQYEADLKTGDTVKILNAGETEVGKYGEQIVFNIKTRNGDKKISFNQSTINVLVTVFGEDTQEWIDKNVKVILDKKLIAGKKAIVPYFVTAGWELDEYGELTIASKEDVKKMDKDVDTKEIPF